MGYSNITNLIHTLINNYTAPHIEIDESTLEDNLEDILQLSSAAASNRNFWLNFLSFLNNEDSINMPLRQSDLNNTKSLGEFINDFADLDLSEDRTEEIYNYITQLIETSKTLSDNDSNLSWNYSVNKLIYDVIKSYERYNNKKLKEDGIIYWNGKEFYISDITHADAGNAFNYDFDNLILINELVIPWKNQDELTFKQVIDSDFCISINNDRKTLFTRSKNLNYDEWMRLLMPQNNKRIEIVDLNRNFWVIGMVLSEISMYLFDENSPHIKLLKETLNEIIELWENVLYLWTSLALYCNTASSNIHIEFCTVPPSEYSHDRLYDYASNITSNFLDEQFLADIKSKFKYLINKYPKRILIVVPYIRYNFLGESKHMSIIFPYLLWHFPFEDDYNGIPLCYKASLTSPPYLLKVSTLYNKDFSLETLGLKDYLVGYREVGNNVKVSTGSLDDIVDTYDYDIYNYNAVARITPSISIDTDGQKLKIQNFRMDINDAIRLSIGNSNNRILRLEGQLDEFNSDNNKQYIEFSVTYNTYKPSGNSYIETLLLQPFYVGECLTRLVKNKKITYELLTESTPLRPFGEDKISELTSIGTHRSKDTNILKRYAELEGSQTPDANGKLKFRLFTGKHISGIHNGGGDEGGTYTWYDLNSSNNIALHMEKLYVDKAHHTKVINEYQYLHDPTIDTSDYELANHTIGSIGMCASLYNPIARKEILTYPRYIHETEDGGVGFPTAYKRYFSGGQSWVWTFDNNELFYLYRKLGDDEYTKDNWFIRQVLVSGALVLPDDDNDEIIPLSSSGNTLGLLYPSNEQILRYMNRDHKNKIKSDLVIGWKRRTISVDFVFERNANDPLSPNSLLPLYFSADNSTRYSRTGPLTLTYDCFIYKIEVHLFGPNNQYERAVYRRRENQILSLGGILFRFLGSGDDITDWELGSDSTSGFGLLRKKLSSQYVLQLSDTNWSKYGTSSMPDFEVSKRNGLFHTSKNGIDSDITSIDILPFSSNADL